MFLQGSVMRRTPHPDFDRNLRAADQPYAKCCGIRSGILCNHRQIRADQSHTCWHPVSKDDRDGGHRCNGIEVVELTAQEVTTWSCSNGPAFAVRAEFLAQDNRRPHVCRDCINQIKKGNNSPGSTHIQVGCLPKNNHTRNG